MARRIAEAFLLLAASSHPARSGSDQHREAAEVLSRAILVARTIPDDGIGYRFGIFSSIAMKQASLEDLDGARLTADEACTQRDLAARNSTRSRLERDLLMSLGQGLGRDGERVAAAKALGEAARLEAREPDADRFYWLGEFAKAQVSVGDRTGARTTADRLLLIAESYPMTHSDRGGPAVHLTRPVALYRASSILAATGENMKAKDARNRASRAAESIRDREERAASLADLAGDMSDSGDVAGLRDLVGIFLESVGGGDDKTDANLLTYVAFASAKADINTALRVSHRITHPELRCRCLSDLANVRALAGDWRAAMVFQEEFIKQVSQMEPSSHVDSDPAKLAIDQASLAVYQAKSNDRVAAATTARAALDRADKALKGKWSGWCSRSYLLAYVSQALWVAGDHDIARQTLIRAQSLLESTRDASAKFRGENQIATTMAEMGEVEAAISLLAAPGHDGRLLRRLLEEGIAVRVKAGDTAKAVDLLDHVFEVNTARKDMSTAEIAEKVARSLAKSGESEAATRWAEAQPLPYAKARALLGVVSGLMDQRSSANP